MSENNFIIISLTSYANKTYGIKIKFNRVKLCNIENGAVRSARCHVNSIFWLVYFDYLALRLIPKFEPEFDFVIILKNKNQTLCQDEVKAERVWVKVERRDTEKRWGIVSTELPNQLSED